MSSRERNLILIVFVIVLFFLVSPFNIQVKADWWDNNWEYCRNITVSQGVDGYQYEVHITDTAHMDEDSIRIINAPCNSGGSEVPHWTEKFETNDAIIWFKGSGTGTQYSIYYNNPSASDTSNGDSVFLLFDDFLGSSINTSKWEITGSPGVSNSKLILSNSSSPGDGVVSLTTFTSGSYSIDAKVTQHNDYVRWKTGFENDYYKFDDGGSYWWGFYVDDSKVDTWGYNVDPNGLVGTVSLIVNQSTTINTPTNSHLISQYSTGLGGVRSYVWECTVYIDWIRVRKYVYPEPTASVGSEQSYSACKVLTESITLNRDVSSSGTCFSINADNIVLDCAGHTITGDDTGYGIYSNKANHTTIKNCNVENFSKGIYFDSPTAPPPLLLFAVTLTNLLLLELLR